jgi:hypothetical protein
MDLMRNDIVETSRWGVSHSLDYLLSGFSSDAVQTLASIDGFGDGSHVAFFRLGNG